MPGDKGDASRSEPLSDLDDNFIKRVISSILGRNDPERRRKRALKQIAKQLRSSKHKFYRVRGELAQPALARFFFDIYKVVGPAQQMLQNAKSSTALRAIVVERRLSDEQRAQRDALSEEAISEAAQQYEPKELANRLRKLLGNFASGFDAATVREINGTYSLLTAFLDFVSFDYYFLLRKFDSSLPEAKYNVQPRFEAIQAKYVTDDLKDFIELLPVMKRSADWSRVFDALQEYRGIEIVNRNAWQKVVGRLEDVYRSGVLTLMIRHAEQNPDYMPEAKIPSEKIVEPYLNTLKAQTEKALQKIIEERRTKRVTQLSEKVFGDSAVARAKHYTEKAGEQLQRWGAGTYRYAAAFNYLKAFLLDYVKRDIRELQDLLVIRGRWADNILSQQLSDAFHQVMDISSRAVAFDDSLGEEGELGMKLRRAMGRSVERDQKSKKLVQEVVDDINDRAYAMISEASQNLVSIGKALKNVLEDHERSRPELLLNWREIEQYSEQPIQERMVDVYKRVYFFIQLIQLHVKGRKGEGGKQEEGAESQAGSQEE